MKWVSLLVFSHSLLLVKTSPDSDANWENQNVFEDPGSPLILTPYIENGKLEKARDLSRVEFPGFPEVRSYAGFFTVDKTYNSNQFLWFFPAESDIEEQAVILWLQGGPGASSLFGLFCENGPLEVKNGSFHRRNTHWSKDHNMIYIDNPVGTGFSFTNDSRGYCTNETEIGEHLYSTLIQFFQIFPELKEYPFFISGESYGGKYIPALGYTIHKRNQESKVKIKLAGLMIGNGWSDPINQLQYSDFLYQIGLVDWNQQKEIEDRQNQITELIKKEAWLAASNATLSLYDFIYICTGNVSHINYISGSKYGEDYLIYMDLIQSAAIRKAIHVGNLTYHNMTTVFNIMRPDIMKSVASWISELLEHYHILFYNGQLDINVAYPLTVNFLSKLNFSASDAYAKSERKILYDVGVNDSMEVAGYLKNAGKLTEVMIRNAGHFAPADQPEWMYDLIVWWRLIVVRGETIEDKVILNSSQYIDHGHNT